jgi:phosphatidylglycerol:prolipoprotein diacylglycerol transferase
MRPVLYRWRGAEIYSYPAMLYLGLVFGIVAEDYAANLAGLNSGHVFIATLLLLIPALIGARLLFVAAYWEHYRREPRRMWRRSEGGAAVYGGLPLSLLVSVPLLNALRLPFGAFWDVATYTILIGLIFTRVGCLLNGCCAGRPSEVRWALYLPNHQGIWQRRIPSPLLEANWGIVLLAGAVAIWQRMPFPGALFLYAMTSYAAGRFVLESTREVQDRVGKIALHHAISVMLVLLALAVLVIAWPR